jgi:hypothetical protein
VLDSTGHRLYRNRRAVDRGEREPDTGQYDDAREVFGVGGAAPLLRRAMLDDVRDGDEVFDADFFAYFEDIDLCWRARTRGWRFGYEPAAVARHHRGGTGGPAAGLPGGGNHRNRLLLMVKNDALPSLRRHLGGIAYTELRSCLYLGRHPPRALLLAYLGLLRLLPRMLRKRRRCRAAAPSTGASSSRGWSPTTTGRPARLGDRPVRVLLHADPVAHRIPGGIGTYVTRLVDALLRPAGRARPRAAGLPLGRAAAARWDRLPTRRARLGLRPLYASWNGLRLPPSGRGADVVHATNLVLPPGGAALVATVHDLNVVLYPELVPAAVAGALPARAAAAGPVVGAAVHQHGRHGRRAARALRRRGRPAGAHAVRLRHGRGRTRDDDAVARLGVRAPYVLTVGTLEPRKNQVALVRAFAAAPDLAGHQLVLAGTAGWGADAVRAAVADSGCADRIVLTGASRRRRWPRCTPAPTCSPCRRSTRASACRCWRRSASACRRSCRTTRRCARWPAARPTTSTRTTWAR